ncbi:MAG: hypothetical protein AAGC72_00515 [Planctomycetota bacterium]
MPDSEMNRVGSFTLTAPGAPAKIYLQAGHDYGADLDPKMVSRARKGELKWITDKDTEGVTYQVIVPKSYEPGRPHGVLVFISAGDGGKLPKPFHTLLEKYRLIAIGADKSGNKRDTLLRHTYAVHAVALINERYDLDPDRIYVSGGSGGGRVCSHVMIMNSDTFTGGIPLIGANACIRMKVADSKGVVVATQGNWLNVDKKRLAKAGREGRFVFMTGSKDFNQANVKLVYEGYRAAGFKQVHYIEEPGLGHSTPSTAYLEKAIRFVDAPLTEAAKKHYTDAKKKQESKRLGDALLLYRKAVMHGRNTDWHADALAQATELQGEYDKAYALVEAAIASKDNAAFRKATTDLRRVWGAIADREVLKELNNRFRQAG